MSVGVDRTGLEQVSKISPNGDSTPTLGRHRSFFEDIFGNIGAVGAPGVGGGAQGAINLACRSAEESKTALIHGSAPFFV